MQYKTGDTIRLTCSFYNFAGDLADPTAITLKVYSEAKTELLSKVKTDLVNPSTGVYYYDYTTPATGQFLVYEFVGTINSLPMVTRKSFGTEWF